MIRGISDTEVGEPEELVHPEESLTLVVREVSFSSISWAYSADGAVRVLGFKL